MRRQSPVFLMICTLLVTSLVAITSSSHSNILIFDTEDVEMTVSEFAPEGIQIVITEYLTNPSLVSDNNGEWFEVYNAGNEAVNLTGFQILDDDFDVHDITGSLFIQPAEYLVFGIDDTYASNGGVEVDYQYSSFILGNSGDEIILLDTEGNLIDKVVYPPEVIFAGVSREFVGPLIPYSTSNSTNDNPSNWDDSTSIFGVGDYGSPGSRNTIAEPDQPHPPRNLQVDSFDDDIALFWDEPASDNGNSITKYCVYRSLALEGPYTPLQNVTNLQFIDTNVEGGETYYYVVTAFNDWGTGEGESYYSEPASGESGPVSIPQILITEFLANPEVSSDGVGEWVEIFNSGPTSIDLEGFILRDDDIDYHVILTSVIIQPGEYLVLGASDDTAENGDVDVDYQYTDFFLGNGGDEIVVLDNESQLLDKVMYDSIDVFSGISKEFKGPLIPYSNSVFTNDDLANWDNCTVLFGDGDYGTPGMRNSDALPDTPFPPYNLEAVGGEMNVGISWDEPLDDLGASRIKYQVYRSTASGGPYTALVNTTNQIYVDTHVTTGVEYFYVITVIANWSSFELESYFSDEVSAIPEESLTTSTTTTTTTTTETTTTTTETTPEPSATGPFGLPPSIFGIDTLYILVGSLVLIIIVLAIRGRK